MEWICRKCGKTLVAPPKNSLSIGPECIKLFNKNQEEKAEKKSYQYARESSVANIGEDVKDSARHRFGDLKSYEDIQNSGQGKKLIVRDKLLKSNPLNLPPTTKENAVSNFILKRSLDRFPLRPYSNELKEDTKLYASTKEKKITYIGQRKEGCDRVTESNINRGFKDCETIELSSDQMDENCRKEYYDRYIKTKDKIEELAQSEDGPLEKIKKLKEYQLSLNDEMDGGAAGYFNKASYVDYGHNVLSLQYRGNTLRKDVENLGEGILSEEEMRSIRFGINIAENGNAIGDKVLAKVNNYFDGNALNVQEDKDRKKFKMADMYVVKESRRGPDSSFETTEKQISFLSDNCKFNAIQFGNTVTDPERLAHLKKFTESVEDLSSALGLTPEEVSFGGKLGIAFGARGSGDALAHYESDRKIINLTRKKGAGALAHEWFHGLEDHWREKTGKKPEDVILPRYAKSNTGNAEVDQAIVSLRSKVDKVEKRWRATDTYKSLSTARKEYFLSAIEIFARIGEQHVKNKLTSSDRENTYLAGCENTDLWPTREESQDMESDLDIIVGFMKGR